MPEKTNQNMSWYKNPTHLALLTIALGITLLIFAPYLLTKTNIGWLNFGGKEHETNRVGDTIGGITAPITGLIGSILVYLSLKAQVDANREVNKNFETDRYDKKLNYFLNELKRRISEIEAKELTTNETTGEETYKVYTGTSAIQFICLIMQLDAKNGENVRELMLADTNNLKILRIYDLCHIIMMELDNSGYEISIKSIYLIIFEEILKHDILRAIEFRFTGVELDLQNSKDYLTFGFNKMLVRVTDLIKANRILRTIDYILE